MANLEKLEQRIQNERTKLDALMLRKTALDSQIAKTKKKVEELEANRRYEYFKRVDAAASKKGIDTKEVYEAFANEDLYSLQEKLENVDEATATEANATSADSSATEDIDRIIAESEVGEIDENAEGTEA